MNQNNQRCKFDTNTNRCSKIKYASSEEPSNFCQYNQKTGYCVLLDNTPKIVRKKTIVLDGDIFENICAVKCWVDGLGETTLVELDRVYQIPESYNLEYGVLKRGLAVVYTKGYFGNNKQKNYMHEIKVKNQNLVIYLDGSTITIYPNNNIKDSRQKMLDQFSNKDRL